MEQQRFDTFFKQAPMTANSYMLDAISNINRSFGEGYAQKHPELVAAFMNVCARDLHTMLLHEHIQNGDLTSIIE